MNPQGILAAANAFKDALKGDVVSEEEIARREKICRSCPMRRISSGAVSRVSKILGVLANRHRVPHEIRDFKCGVCQCNLMLLLPATEKDQHKDSPPEASKRPANCWMLTKAPQSD